MPTKEILQAYIDPTSGMLTLQLLVAGIAGGVIYFRGLLSRTIRRLSGRKSVPPAAQETSPDKPDAQRDRLQPHE